MCTKVQNEFINRETMPTGNPSKTSNSIGHVIGEWGVWQCRSVFLIFLCKIPAAWFMACLLFTSPLAKIDEFRCKSAIISVSSTINSTEWLYVAQPSATGDTLDACHIYRNRSDSHHWQHKPITNSNAFDTAECNAFVHNSAFHSLVTQFDLVCSRTIWIAVTQFFHLCGVLTGGIFATKLLELYAHNSKIPSHLHFISLK